MRLFRPDRRHRIAGLSRQHKALLAGGLVLGLGAAATLAAWSDNVLVTGAFSAGSFGTEVNVGSGWTNGDGVNEMTFNATAMYPGAVVYAPVLVRTTSHSDLGAELTLSGNGGPGGFLGALTYRVVSDIVTVGPTVTCNASRFESNASFVLGSASEWVTMSTVPAPRSTQRISAAGADFAAYCFEVKLTNTALTNVQGAVAEHTWTWDAASVSTEGVP